MNINPTTRCCPRIWTVILILLALSFVPSALCDRKKHAPQTAQEETEAAEPKIDMSQLVWPRPPDTARIRWLGQFKGEPAPSAPSDSTKKKQKWMDRLAGKKQIDEIKAPHPHILVEPNGVAVHEVRSGIFDCRSGCLYGDSGERNQEKGRKQGGGTGIHRKRVGRWVRI